MSDQNVFPEVAENVRRILYEIGEAEQKYRGTSGNVRLMAVTKTVPPEAVNAAVEAGVRLLGENRVQEYLGKKEFYSPKAEVHFIGSLQTNKVKYIIDSVSLIHSADSVKLCSEINRLSGVNNRVTDVLVEINIGNEMSKGGIAHEALNGFLDEISGFQNIRVRGLMTIPPPEESERCFEKMQRIFEDSRSRYKNMDILSMGMSADYITAVKYGSGIVRIGTGIFGARKYNI